MSPGQAEGVGLSNTRERLRTLYADRAKIAFRSPPDGGTEVILTIPFRPRRM
jgi:sensor histidine kinase YesM